MKTVDRVGRLLAALSLLSTVRNRREIFDGFSGYITTGTGRTTDRYFINMLSLLICTCIFKPHIKCNVVGKVFYRFHRNTYEETVSNDDA